MAKIVLIERTNVLKLRLERLFLKLGYTEVITYQDSLIPLNTFLTKLQMFEVIVIDYDQFVEEFTSLLEVVKKLDKLNNIKIVVLKASGDINEMATLLTSGVDEIILKPFNDELMYKKLDLNRSKEHSDNMGIMKNIILGGNSVIAWCQDYEIGVEEIDNEHKEIIEHFEKLYTLMKTGHGLEYFSELVGFLEKYVGSHFEHEEILQKKIGYTGYEAHKVLHDAFKEQVTQIIVQYKETVVTNSDLVKLNLFIKEWLVNHIMVEDKRIGEFIKTS